MNIISFALWGDRPMYIQGAFENIKLARAIYPEYQVRIYSDTKTDVEVLKRLERAGAQLVVVNHSYPDWYNLFIRFFVNDDPEVSRYLIRDTDSRLSWRERACVDQWERSGKAFHCMRDHPWHDHVKFLGGMWGCKTGVIPNMTQAADYYAARSKLEKGVDQRFLGSYVWPFVEHDRLEHDSIQHPHSKNEGALDFPTVRHDYEFVGCVYDENNQRNDDYLELARFMQHQHPTK